jgi:hypothetical protein
VIAAVLGAAVWALSPALTGRAEPWDSEGPYYVCALVIAGALAGGLYPKSLWAHYLGAVVGQAAYEFLFLKLGPLFPLGVVVLLGYGIVFVAGATLAAFIRLRW